VLTPPYVVRTVGVGRLDSGWRLGRGLAGTSTAFVALQVGLVKVLRVTVLPKVLDQVVLDYLTEKNLRSETL